MKYANKSFSVPLGLSDEGKRNWDRTFGKKKPKPRTFAEDAKVLCPHARGFTRDGRMICADCDEDVTPT
jgi:hypothetical protein